MAKKDKKDEASKAANDKEKDASTAKLGNSTHPPLMLELAFSLPVFILIVMDIVVAVLSFMAGSAALSILIRVVITTVVLGVILWLVTYQVTTGYMQTAGAKSHRGDDQASRELNG